MQESQHSPSRPPSASELDEDTLAFVRKVFHFARAGEAGELATLLDQGLPPNLRNERGDSLLMLAWPQSSALSSCTTESPPGWKAPPS